MYAAKKSDRLCEYGIVAGVLVAVIVVGVIGYSIYAQGQTSELFIAFLVLAVMIYPVWKIFGHLEKQ
ncbi:hypothetical protein QP027_12150 [Corynebacterium breve]|uniref:Uncharacterized protein n=1 Tax=Corynebacterium breve TaxID=3049799 RepID=A0ABY8VFB2_9CORY|nr:hypothetical protein [Corynebacterium breve]WIM67802.1 hypothetical protein QP027_12150 [Corynebacterium breve]